MDEKKHIKLSLATTICIVIILLLVVSLIITVYYYNSINKEEKHIPITSENFKNYIGQHQFNVYNALNYLDDSTFKEGVKVGYLTEKNDNKDFQVNFFEFKDEAHTMYAYYDEIISIEKNNNGEFIETNENISNYSKYTAFSNGYYYVMIKIDNTIIFTKIEKDNKEVVDNLLQELGY